ncbi:MULTISPECIES: acid-shock protein [Providencia]|uniref:Acid-shock protein n=1 Tax=Providencia rettgeri TaxID=587 RepID=A0A3R8W7V9_PRORE|nr:MULTISPECIES: acid-shock protein [Providencia]ELR5073710.1 acid-shock protein [Providencia stuartii]ELR5068510.1 acid-shock protein [Providencia rettgeri]ELR5216757.1 acid-shock protein [Providencia rettgeri]ELR5221391.1 acid-shock protein [Providencia rettgeri]MBV2190729.1 acid-shock protein [Providencia rettgeri]
MKKLLAIATVLSLAVSGAALANTTVKSEPVSPVAQSHQITKSHQVKINSEKKANKGKSAQVSKSTK